MNIHMKFPKDLPRFIAWVYFKPLSLYQWVNELDPTVVNIAALLTRAHDRPIRSFKVLALFSALALPLLFGFGSGIVLVGLGIDVNWLRLAFYLVVGIALSLTFSVPFCIAFLLPFSVALAFWSANLFTPSLGVLFSLMLGLAYGLNGGSAMWGLTAGLVYGVAFGLLLNPLSGLLVGASFLIGYFRILLYLLEAPLAWILGTLAPQGQAVRLWRFHPVCWDELIWFPLPRLERHLLALWSQDESAAKVALHQVQESFRQGWAAKHIAKES